MINKKKIIAGSLVATLASATLLNQVGSVIFADGDNVQSVTQDITRINEESTELEGVVINGSETINSNVMSIEEMKVQIDNLNKLIDLYKKHSNEIKYDVNKNLSHDDIKSRYEEIENKYDVNDELSQEDEEFIIRFDRDGKTDIQKLIRDAEAQITNLRTKGTHDFTSTLGTKSFSNSKLQVGLTMNFSGNVTWKNGHTSNPAVHRFSISSTSSCYSNHVKSRTPQMEVTTYGVNIMGKIGVVHKETLKGATQSGKGDMAYHDSTSDYNVTIHVKTTVTPRVYFSTQEGSSTFIDGFK